MYYSALRLKLIGSSPETKYFFIKLLQHFDKNEPIEKQVREVAKDFGVTDRVVTNSFNYLKQNGYLRHEVTPPIKGFARSRYYFSPKSTEHSTMEGQPLNHNILIDNLLKPDVKDGTGVTKHHPLNISNRMLLIVLLAHADECGVVRTLGVSDIFKLTGMRKDRLRSQLVKLKNLGYIHSHVGGATGYYIFGSVESSYFLNLKHPNYRDHKKNGVTFLYAAPAYESSEAQQIFRMATHASPEKRKWQLDHSSVKAWVSIRRYTSELTEVIDYDEGFHSIASLFKDLERGSFSRLLQSKLEEYASFMLSNNLTNNDFYDEQLIEKIKDEAFPDMILEPRPDREIPSNEQMETLAGFLYKVSLKIAQSVKKLLSFDVSLELEQMNHSILPVINNKSRRGSFLSVTSFYKDQSTGSVAYYVFKSGVDGIAHNYTLHSCEEQISLDSKYMFSLLTKPKGKVERWTKSKESEES